MPTLPLEMFLDVGKGAATSPAASAIRTVEHDPSLREDLDRLVEPTSRGDPESPLRWTCMRQLLEMFLDGRKTHQIGVRCDTAKSKHGSYYLNPGIQRVT